MRLIERQLVRKKITEDNIIHYILVCPFCNGADFKEIEVN